MLAIEEQAQESSKAPDSHTFVFVQYPKKGGAIEYQRKKVNNHTDGDCG